MALPPPAPAAAIVVAASAFVPASEAAAPAPALALAPTMQIVSQPARGHQVRVLSSSISVK